MELLSAGYLEDVLPLVVPCFCSFKQCHEGAVGARCRISVEGRSVGKWMVRDGPLVFLLVPDEGQRHVIGIRLGFLWDRE